MVGRELTTALLLGCNAEGTQDNTRTTKCHYPQQIDPITGMPSTTGHDDGYGPMIISLLELTALRVGIMPRAQLLLGSSSSSAADYSGGNSNSRNDNGSVAAEKEVPTHDGTADGDNGGLLWSGIADDGATTTYNQTLGSSNVYTLHSNSTSFSGALNGKQFFTCTAGVRVVTELGGNVVAVVGIDNVVHSVTLSINSFHQNVRGAGGGGSAAAAAAAAAAGSVQITVNPNEVWRISVHGGSSGSTVNATLAPSAPFTAPHSPAPHHGCKMGAVLGCYTTNGTSDKGMPHPLLPKYQPQLHDMVTVENCAAACFHSNSKLAGIVGGNHCACGDVVANASKLLLPAEECWSKNPPNQRPSCSGNHSEMHCGGMTAMVVYNFTCA